MGLTAGCNAACWLARMQFLIHATTEVACDGKDYVILGAPCRTAVPLSLALSLSLAVRVCVLCLKQQRSAHSRTCDDAPDGRVFGSRGVASNTAPPAAAKDFEKFLDPAALRLPVPVGAVQLADLKAQVYSPALAACRRSLPPQFPR
jgi:hypothetical protein